VLQPREWRVERTPEFEVDFERLSDDSPRLHQHVTAWEFALERQPFTQSAGLTTPDDDHRVVGNREHSDGVEYIAGVRINRSTHVVTLMWLDRAEPT